MNLKINGFLNISFGENKESVIKKINERNGILDSQNSTEESLIFNNINFAGRETSFLAFHFINDQFCRAMVFLKANLESKTVNLYKEIKYEINERFYKTRQDFENYEAPFEQNDGYIDTAISLGKANFSSFWSFKNEQAKEDDFISLKINENFYIIITYENGDLMDKYESNRKKNNYQDY
ncbi:hypothetical protein [Chryseobacterium sp.]|uniref:hypothetical protein n=1 Tax=Chryseobacterium sp. TaxID=1871047 RepID=UPI00289D497B|nr:hypothetical protein [Chryseobacterium sp.]